MDDLHHLHPLAPDDPTEDAAWILEAHDFHWLAKNVRWLRWSMGGLRVPFLWV